MFLINVLNEIPDFLNTSANSKIINPDEFEFAGSFGL